MTGRAGVSDHAQRTWFSETIKKWPFCRVHGVNSGELRSGSRRDEIVEARRVFSLPAVKELG